MEAFGALIGAILMFLLWVVMAVISVSITVGIVWIVFKIFGIDIEGFTATLVV